MYGIMICKLMGLRHREAFKSVMHPYRGREWHVETDEAKADYACGYSPPHYPVPALNECLWCGRDNLSDTYCLFVSTGEWCPDFCMYL